MRVWHPSLEKRGRASNLRLSIQIWTRGSVLNLDISKGIKRLTLPLERT